MIFDLYHKEIGVREEINRKEPLPHEKVEGGRNKRDWVEAGVNSQVWPDHRLVMATIIIIQRQRTTTDDNNNNATMTTTTTTTTTPCITTTLQPL